MQYTLSVLVENHAGVLSKISGLFSRRGFNIDSLAVGVTNNPDVSRITIVANGDEYVVEPVIKVKRLREGEFIQRELVLVKVHCPAAKRAEIIKTAEIMQAKIVDVAQSCVTVEYSECTNRINTLLDLLRPYGIREIVRTGTIAIDRGNSALSV